MVHWVMEGGALAYMLPSPNEGSRPLPISLGDLLEGFDGLLLHGGADMAPQSYQEEPIGRWLGDAVRDRYEAALLKLCMDRDIPVLGVCRGMQVINVALGGSLYQDIETQRPGALVHRNWDIYDENGHEIDIVAGSGLSACYGGLTRAYVNSIHHQAVKDVAPSLQVEAVSPSDGVVEALRLPTDRYVVGVQWHPEFMDNQNPDTMDTAPLRQEFLAAARARAEAR
jgi:putative glutamine amidotransferase